jgi:hypothetical protein
MQKKIMLIIASALTLSQVVFLIGPLFVWIYTGDKVLWYSWPSDRISAAWFAGICLAVFSWAPYSIME